MHGFASFPSTPRQPRQQASQDQLQQSAPGQLVRKASSLLDLRKRIIPSTVGKTGKMDHNDSGSGNHNTTGSISSHGNTNTWTKLLNAASGQHNHAGLQEATPLTPSSIAPSIWSRDASMESVGLSAYLRMRPPPSTLASPVGNIQILGDAQSTLR